jgi:hypothetical protein
MCDEVTKDCVERKARMIKMLVHVWISLIPNS